MEGKIIKGIAGFYEVMSGGTKYMCKARGLFRKDGRKPLVGDMVLFTEAGTKDSEASITELLPRRNRLVRPAVSNVDQALIVLAVKKPDPQFYLLDQYLCTMEKQGIPTAILWNKADLGDDALTDGYSSGYLKAGYRCMRCSTATGEGIPEVLAYLKGKTTVLAGPSGVGKSSLTNCICPEAAMVTGEISKKISRGKQTTRHTELFFVGAAGDDSFLLDTPGFTSVFVDAEADEARFLFPEIGKREGQCRFLDCRHISEPGCAVKDAVSDGEISELRYESYVKIWKELSERRKY